MTDSTFHTCIEQLSGQTVSLYFQCFRCTSGCPAADRMDLPPHRMMEAILANDALPVLTSRAIWACVQCSTCSARCPNGIDVAAVIEALRVVSHEEGKDKEERTWLFDTVMTESIGAYGRVYELGVAVRFNRLTGGIMKNRRMAAAMVRKGRLSLLPHRAPVNRRFTNRGATAAGPSTVRQPAGREEEGDG